MEWLGLGTGEEIIQYGNSLVSQAGDDAKTVGEISAGEVVGV